MIILFERGYLLKKDQFRDVKISNTVKPIFFAFSSLKHDFFGLITPQILHQGKLKNKLMFQLTFFKKYSLWFRVIRDSRNTDIVGIFLS